MLPVLISDPEVRERAIETFQSEEFKNNIEEYFVQNIKVGIEWSVDGAKGTAKVCCVH